jgi:hypothetical protein
MVSAVEEELSNFLWCVFNQNMQGGNPESALQKFIDLSNQSALQSTVDNINQFLKIKQDESKRTEFISSNCSIWFEGIEKKPVKWLEEVQIKLNTAAKNKK